MPPPSCMIVRVKADHSKKGHMAAGPYVPGTYIMGSAQLPQNLTSRLTLNRLQTPMLSSSAENVGFPDWGSSI